jgi:hypothetical protein
MTTSLKRKRLDFMDGWSTHDSEMLGPVDDEADLLATISDSQGGLDKVIAAVNPDNALERDVDDV